MHILFKSKKVICPIGHAYNVCIIEEVKCENIVPEKNTRKYSHKLNSWKSFFEINHILTKQG